MQLEKVFLCDFMLPNQSAPCIKDKVIMGVT